MKGHKNENSGFNKTCQAQFCGVRMRFKHFPRQSLKYKKIRSVVQNDGNCLRDDYTHPIKVIVRDHLVQVRFFKIGEMNFRLSARPVLHFVKITQRKVDEQKADQGQEEARSQQSGKPEQVQHE
jgi:hypothetical protein